MIWWADQPRRAQQERNEVGELAERAHWLANVEWRFAADLRLAADFDLEIGERRIPLTLVYPSFFPDAAPSIFARDATLLSTHQYGPTGELCLEYRPDNWMTDVTGAMMIASAFRLLSSEQDTGQIAPSEHRMTPAQRSRQAKLRFLFSNDTLGGISLVPQGQIAEAAIQEQDLAGYYVAELSRIGPAAEPVWLVARKRGGETITLRATVVGIPVGTGHDFKDFDDLKALLWAQGFSSFATDLQNASDTAVLVLSDGVRLHVPMVFGPTGQRKLINYDPIFAEQDRPRLDPEYERLKAAKVAIIGCGSVGSKVAVQLARSGVAKFVLVDGDVLASGNLVRNELDWRSVGLHKAPALGARLKEIDAGCDVDSRTTLLGGQESGGAVSSAMSAIEKCDLVIDATADAAVFNLCSAIARRAKKPMCWAQVFGGGAGGIIVRLRPGVDPTPFTARQRLEGWYSAQGVEWPEDGPSQPYAETAGEGTTLIADDADVTVIASHLSRFVIDLLARPDATIFPYSAYLIGLRDRWLFTAPFDVRPIDLGESDVWGAEQEPGDVEALRQLISDLIPGDVDAD